MELTIFAAVYFLFRLGHYLADGVLMLVSFCLWPIRHFRKGEQWWFWRMYKSQKDFRFVHNALGTALLVLGLLHGYRLLLDR
jgi:hypothetical protein